MIGR
jgi:DNA replication licensing factor MCM3